MIDLILPLQADLDIQAAFSRYEDYQPGGARFSCVNWTRR